MQTQDRAVANAEAAPRKRGRCAAVPSVFPMLVASGRLFPLVFLFTVSAAHAESVDAALARARSTFRLVETIEFQATYFIRDKLQRQTFIAKQSKFLNEMILDAENAAAGPEVIFAYDGARHQELGLKAKLLSHSNAPLDPVPVGAANIWTIPYLWLLEKGTPFTLAEVREAHAWDRVAKFARLAGDEIVAGKNCVRLEIQLETALCNVYLSPAEGYYPLRWEMLRPDGSVRKSMDVKSWESFRVNGSTAIVPTLVEFNTVGVNAPLDPRILITEGTLRVNQPVGDDVFTLSPTRAEEMVDRDNISLSPRKETYARHSSRSGVFYVSLALLILAAAAAVFAWYVRRS